MTSNLHHVIQCFQRPMAIIRSGDNGPVIEAVNDKLIGLLGYTEKELLNMNPLQLIDKKFMGVLHVKQARLMKDKHLRSEVILINKLKQPMNLLLEIDLLSCTGEPDTYAVSIDDIRPLKWIHAQINQNNVRAAGIINADLIIDMYNSYYDPIAEDDAYFEDLSILQLVPAEIHGHLQEKMEEIKRLKQSMDMTVKTIPLSNMVELEVTLRSCPFFDGWGRLINCAFIIFDLKQSNETATEPAIKLKIIMAQRSISAQTLAEATGISLQTISKLRNGKIKRPQRLTAELIASELGVQVTDIWEKNGK
ncbi:helix-turn-helix transcriptional regulator [Paenibacillus sp. y28]|uniref:helix-turn-helix transcriptional regulator n=1 Tax=Paenibacillus sp. y28 TaxID=3129110 RepID=UPI003015D57C